MAAVLVAVLTAVQAPAQAAVVSGVDGWTILNTIASAVTAIAALIAVLLVIPQLTHNTQALQLQTTALQLQVFDSVFKDIRQLDHSWIEQNFDHGMTKEQRQAWCASFFNTLEYLCFLMNHRMVRQDELRQFFDTALPAWWKQFNDYRKLGLIHDAETLFSEFKGLCKERKLTG
jgi:hypothetical protein